MEATQSDLEAVDCWFDSDRAGGPEMTAFKREARWRQHHWAVHELGIATFGSHIGRRIHPSDPPREIRNGTKLTQSDADRGANYLTPDLHEVARSRVANPQRAQTLDRTRLFRDLLSSMPMAFNLFGEASLSENEVSRQALAVAFSVPAREPSNIVFEWSPERNSRRYTRDRTAFDVALVMGSEGMPRTVIGIETKYHEHPTKETPRKNDAETKVRFDEQTDFLVSLAVDSGVFRQGWEGKVLGTPLRQIWRDHLLALSMRRSTLTWAPTTKYALVHPRRNVAFAEAGRAYAELLVDGSESFQVMALEDVLDAAFAHGGDTKDAFRRRYVW